MHRKPEVCILPVAGLSTRNLPATKVLHKGFLTLNNLPIIQYAINACAEIGIKDVVFVYSDQSCKHLFETYFSPNAWLEKHLEEKGKTDLLKAVRGVIPEGMNFHFAEQSEPKGNGHAVLMAKDIVGKRDFVVMWPDDVYINVRGGKGILRQLLDVYEEEGGMVENIMEFPREQMVRYGALIGCRARRRNRPRQRQDRETAFGSGSFQLCQHGSLYPAEEIMDIRRKSKRAPTARSIWPTRPDWRRNAA